MANTTDTKICKFSEQKEKPLKVQMVSFGNTGFFGITLKTVIFLIFCITLNGNEQFIRQICGGGCGGEEGKRKANIFLFLTL